MATRYFSDTHIGHRKPFIFGARGHESIEAHDAEIAATWRATVADDDDIVFVGDFTMGSARSAIEFIESMPWGTFTWVIGNHDPKASKIIGRAAEHIKRPFAVVDSIVIGDAYVCHYPPADVYVHGDESGNAFDFPVDPEAIIAANPGVRRFIHGHSHSAARRSGPRSVNVGWDAWKGFPTEADVVIAGAIG